ncbi:MAG: lysophospholipid acyltransferase family protein [Flavobacteriaceae bacterium]
MKRIFYFLVKHLLKYYNYIYFRSVKVYGLNHIPKDGGVLFSPNHQGAFLDPLLIGSLTPNRITSLTRSDVFGGPLQWFLDSFQMLPVYRIRNGYSNLKKNDLTFKKCYQILGDGNYLLMFSEGGHHNEYYLQNLSKGSSRLAYQALQKNPGKKIYLQPAGINYGHHQQPRCSLHLVFGKPIELGEQYDPKLSDAENINHLKILLQERMKDCLWLPDNTDIYAEQKQKINRKTTRLSFDELKSTLANNHTELPSRKLPSSWIRFMTFFLSIPNIIPLWISRKIISKFEDIVFYSSMKYALGVFFFPLWWLVSSVGILYGFGYPLMVSYLLLCIVTLFIRQKILLI